MPRAQYSNQSEGEPRPFAITEPESRTSPRPSGFGGSDEVSHGVQAKEPDRPGTARRVSPSSRSRAAVEEAPERTQPRGRSTAKRSSGGTAARRSTTTGGRGAQARRTTGRAQTERRGTALATKTGRGKKSRRGFAAMSPEQQREIARKGGLTVSRNRRHMADIGRVGGEHSHGGRKARR